MISTQRARFKSSQGGIQILERQSLTARRPDGYIPRAISQGKTVHCRTRIQETVFSYITLAISQGKLIVIEHASGTPVSVASLKRYNKANGSPY